MAHDCNTQIGYYFEWNTKLPSQSSVSPVFIFRGFHFRFRITKEDKARFFTYIEQPSGEAHFLPLLVNSYTGYNNVSFLVIYWLSLRSKAKSSSVKIHNYEGMTGGDVKFIFQFEYDAQQISKTNNPPVLDCSSLCQNSCLKTLSQDFGKVLDAESGKDVVLKCGDSTVRAHKVVLASRSRVFESMLQSEMVEGRTGHVEVKDVDSDVFQEFVRYLYTGVLPELDVGRAKKLYAVGDLYEVKSLMWRCSKFLSVNLTTETACDYLVMAEDHSDEEFKERVISYILEKKTPLTDETWQAFSVGSPALAVEVLNRFVKLQNIV